jgi:hypothetical protein
MQSNAVRTQLVFLGNHPSCERSTLDTALTHTPSSLARWTSCSIWSCQPQPHQPLSPFVTATVTVTVAAAVTVTVTVQLELQLCTHFRYPQSTIEHPPDLRPCAEEAASQRPALLLLTTHSADDDDVPVGWLVGCLLINKSPEYLLCHATVLSRPGSGQIDGEPSAHAPHPTRVIPPYHPTFFLLSRNAVFHPFSLRSPPPITISNFNVIQLQLSSKSEQPAAAFQSPH